MTDISKLRSCYETPSEVANFFLDMGEKLNVPITPMKLIKMVYIAYGWALGAESIKLFDEKIEAWKYGPVIPSIYHEFKHFGGSPIVGFLSREYDPFEDIEADTPKIPNKDSDVLDVLNFVWDVYKNKSATELMRATHKEGTPWHDVWHKNPYGNDEIKPESIHKFYVDLIDNVLKNAA